MRDRVVDPQVVSVNISRPVESGSRLAVEGSSSPVAYTEDIGCLLGGVGYFGESRVPTTITAEFEYVSLVLDDIL